MRLPDHVIDRVRGVMLVAALSACGSEASSPAPPASIAPPPETVVAAPTPIDPVAYARADEAERLARLDHEELASVDRRMARINQLRRERASEAILGAFGGQLLDPRDLGTITGTGPGIGGNPVGGHVCMACGRG